MKYNKYIFLMLLFSIANICSIVINDVSVFDITQRDIAQGFQAPPQINTFIRSLIEEYQKILAMKLAADIKKKKNYELFVDFYTADKLLHYWNPEKRKKKTFDNNYNTLVDIPANIMPELKNSINVKTLYKDYDDERIKKIYTRDTLINDHFRVIAEQAKKDGATINQDLLKYYKALNTKLKEAVKDITIIGPTEVLKDLQASRKKKVDRTIVTPEELQKKKEQIALINELLDSIKSLRGTDKDRIAKEMSDTVIWLEGIKGQVSKPIDDSVIRKYQKQVNDLIAAQEPSGATIPAPQALQSLAEALQELHSIMK